MLRYYWLMACSIIPMVGVEALGRLLPMGSACETENLRLSELVSALSYALDITEGQPEGHAVRSCMIGMRLAKEIYLLPRQRSALFYALLLKDLGCSSNASKVARLFGTEHHEVEIGWNDLLEAMPRLVFHQDEPIADWVCVPLHFVSRLARVACCTMPSVAKFSRPTGSLDSGMPNRITAGIPNLAIDSISCDR